MLCKEQVAQLCDREAEIRRAGAELVVIGSGTAQHARWFAEEQKTPVRVLTDPDRVAFRAIEARRGLGTALRPGTFLAAFRAWRRGFRQTATQGDPLQQGAVWIVSPGGQVVYRYTSRFGGDHPDPDEILRALTGAARPGDMSRPGAVVSA